MPFTKSLLPLLRPLTAPIPRQANHQFLRFSTTTRLRLPKEPSSIPQTTPEAPSPSRAADLAAAEAATDADSAQSPAPKAANLPSKRKKSSTRPKSKSSPKPIRKSKAPKPTPPPVPIKPNLPPLKYHVARTRNNNMRIYTDYKRGGNYHVTAITKVTGDLNALREDLLEFMGHKSENIQINHLTRSVKVKGHHKEKLAEFLLSKSL